MTKRIIFCFLSLLLSDSGLFAQELQNLYEKSLQEKNRLENVEKGKEEKTKKFIAQALDKGAFWKCDKSVYIFYQGYVLISAKDDGSDAGKPPFDLIGNYTSTRQGFTKFTFPTLPYENVYELNLNAKELVIFRHSLNKLDKVSCTSIR
jgi:hypothetical protein